VKIQVKVLWVVVLCNVVGYQCSGGLCCLHCLICIGVSYSFLIYSHYKVSYSFVIYSFIYVSERCQIFFVVFSLQITWYMLSGNLWKYKWYITSLCSCLHQELQTTCVVCVVKGILLPVLFLFKPVTLPVIPVQFFMHPSSFLLFYSRFRYNNKVHICHWLYIVTLSHVIPSVMVSHY